MFETCDRCCAKAQVRVDLLSGGQLFFCLHHVYQYADNLQPITFELVLIGDLVAA